MVKLKSSSFFPAQTSSKLKQELKGNLFGDNADINKLPDEAVLHILSCMSLKEAARTSVLAHRWKYLWRYMYGTLQFDFRDFVTAARDLMEVEKFLSRVNTVLELHQGWYVEGLVILFEGMHEDQYDLIPRMSPTIDSWVCFAVQKQVERFDLHLSVNHKHEFPSVETLKSHIPHPFSRLRSLRLVAVEIKDEVVHYLLASCPNLEHVRIRWSSVTKNLRVVDPPSLKVLELMECYKIQSMEISAESLVSLAYTGEEKSLVLKKTPNLRELTVGKGSFLYFLREVKEHSSPLHQLISEKPVVGLPDLPQLCFLKRLEVRVCSKIDRSLLFFTSFIKASPQLYEFRIELSYIAMDWDRHMGRGDRMPFPAIGYEEAEEFDHTSLKVVEMGGYVGCWSADELVSELLKSASSVERAVIDTQSDYYDDPDLDAIVDSPSFDPTEIRNLGFAVGAITRVQSKNRAQHLVSTFPHQIKSIIS